MLIDITEYHEIEFALNVIQNTCNKYHQCSDCPLFIKGYDECIFESTFPQNVYDTFKSGD